MRMEAARESEVNRVPLKTVLQNFLNHVESLEARKAEGDDAYDKEFQSLKAFSDSLKMQPEFSSSEGEKEVNRKKNRYKDILPFDCTRVGLSEYPGVPGSDYINANYIKGASGSNAYIASQGPLPHTVNDFWRMVVEAEVQVIVMACNEQEAGKHKCEKYWNDLEDDEGEKQFGKYAVKLLKSREICPDFLVRTMRLKWASEEKEDKEEERTVCQFHYSAWPDHGIPDKVKPLLEMVRLIRDCQASETLPVLVHCSAGCGRTGTICAIDFIWGLLRTGRLKSDFSLYELVKEMRRQRIAMVQTVDQYILVHRAVRELFLEQLRVIDAHPYENVDEDGLPLVEMQKEDLDYETVFVTNNSNCKDKDIDKILSLRMARPLKEDDKENSLEKKEEILKQTEEEEEEEEEEKLFEPPNNKEQGSKIKKGNLRLTQTEDGGWKLEELLDAVKVKESSPQLLRRPSIKKIRQFFQQKDTDLVTSALSKLPKFEAAEATSKSVPGSLDRRTTTSASPQKSVSSERLSFNEKENKPLLPIKRSKSMKAVASKCKEDEDSFGFNEIETPKALQPPPKPKRVNNVKEDTIDKEDKLEAARLLKDCQDYLMASFETAERESERLLHQTSSGDSLEEQPPEASKSNNSSPEYANVSFAAAEAAQRKVHASFLGKPRERRNSFREAVEASEEKRPYEAIWFEQEGSKDGGQHIYANVLKTPESTRQPLQSVSLVSEAVKAKSQLHRQGSSSSSVTSASNSTKGPPPPYKQPPMPNLRPGPQRPPQKNTYFSNVPLRRPKERAPAPHTTKDDLALTHFGFSMATTTTNYHNSSLGNDRSSGLNSSRSAGQLVPNRFSCGDFSAAHRSLTNGLTVKSAGESPVRSSSKVGQAVSSDFLAGIDLDAVAAMMQGNSSRAGSSNSQGVSSSGGHGGHQQPHNRPFGRTLAGVLSGAAANLRSRFSHLSNSPVEHPHHHQGPSPPPLGSRLPPVSQRLQAEHELQGGHEQSPSLIPLTVPGADIASPLPVFPYGYPDRLDMRPVGPRDPPSHFQRKQEYL